MLARLEYGRTFIMTSTILGVIALCGALAHALGWLPIESLDHEPRVYASAAVELLCGVLLLAAAFSLGSIRATAWRNAIGAHLAALLVLLFGVIVFTGAMHVSVLSAGFHAGLFLLILLNTVGLWRLRPRNPLRRAGHEIAARMS